MPTTNQTTGLLEERLDLHGRKIVSSEATYVMGYERGRMISQLLVEDSEKEKSDPMTGDMLVNIYASLVACSTGDIPTREEFTQMREVDVGTWLTAVRKLNPHWFVWLDDAEKEIDKELSRKKKSKTVKKSSKH